LLRNPEKIWSPVKLQASRSHHLQQLERAIKPKQSAILWLVVPKRPHVRFDERDLETGPLPQGAPISPLLVNLYMRRFLLGWKQQGAFIARQPFVMGATRRKSGSLIQGDSHCPHGSFTRVKDLVRKIRSDNRKAIRTVQRR
jgi:hypothetical protein